MRAEPVLIEKNLKTSPNLKDGGNLVIQELFGGNNICRWQVSRKSAWRLLHGL